MKETKRETIERNYHEWIEIYECDDKIETIDKLIKEHDKSDAHYLIEATQRKLSPSIYYKRKKRSLCNFKKDEYVAILAQSSCDADRVIKRHFVAMLKELRELYQSRINELIAQ